MNWQALSAYLTNDFQSDPQKVARIERAVGQVAEGLQVLASCGLHYHLEEGSVPTQDYWPRKVFHAEAPEGVLCYGPEHKAELGEGWHDTLEAAQRWMGIRRQFTGRGGRHVSGLPALTSLPTTVFQMSREERIEFVRQAQEAEIARNAQ